MTDTLAGHPVAMKVGGRRLSVSKSPPVKSYLSTSPSTTTKDPAAAAESKKEDSKAAAEDYPRPETGKEHSEHNPHTEGQDSEKDKDHQKSRKDKINFDAVKQQHVNKNPANSNNFNIKQPSGKVL